MGSLFGGGRSSPPPLPPLPTREDPAVEEARKRARIAAQRRKGRRATILTSGLGDVSAANVERKTLLGQ